jgi:GTPase SAR1 family protein
MNTINYDKLLQTMIYTERDLLILGAGGTGKTTLIKKLVDYYRNIGKSDELLLCAPTGIAAINIGGITIQRLFGILPYTYFCEYHGLRCHNIEAIQKAKVLVIDEISMLRLEILDIVDRKLRMIKGNMKQPFGGIRLILLGDLFQLPPVIQKDNRIDEYTVLQNYYPKLTKGDYGFYNANVMRCIDYFDTAFDIYELKSIHRQQDVNFRNMLMEIRTGNVSDITLRILNKRYTPIIPHDSSILHLALTNSRVNSINDKYLSELPGHLYHSYPTYTTDDGYKETCITSNNRFATETLMKEGMNIMFIKMKQPQKFKKSAGGLSHPIQIFNPIEFSLIVMQRTNMINFIFNSLNHFWAKINPRCPALEIILRPTI